jgi:hypothetical protein
MAEEKKTRPFWKTRRFKGALFGMGGLALATIPGAPIIAAIGAFAVTTQTMAVVCGFIGTYVFGWGQGRAEEKAKAAT